MSIDAALDDAIKKLPIWAAKKMAKADGWHNWPTVRQAAKRFNLPQGLIQDIVESADNLYLIVGMRCGNGIADFDRRGDYKIEYYGDELD